MELNSSTLFIQFMNSIALAMNLFIIAVGLSLIFGVLRVISFAHGAFFMLGAYVLFSVVDYFGETGLSFWMGVSAAVVGLGVISFAVERLLLRHLYDKEHLLQLLFTFALVLIVGDVTKFIWGAEQACSGRRLPVRPDVLLPDVTASR